MFSDWMRTHQVPLVKTKDLPGMYKIHSHVIGPSTFKLQEIFDQSEERLRHNDWPHWKQCGSRGQKICFFGQSISDK